MSEQLSAEEALIQRAEGACRPCGPCDSGLPMGCHCDPEPRAVIAGLLDLLTSRAARAEERERWAGEVRALIETLPRNEFGDQHYLAVEAAYANVARLLPDTREDLRPREGA